MAKRPPYCLPEDVLRLFDAQESLDRLSAADKDLIRDAIDDVGSDFEIKTKHAFRLTRVGSPGASETYEYADIEGSHHSPPLRVLLDHRYILPFDSTEGDALEYRSGRDEWTAITDDAGDEFTLEYEAGALKVYRWLINRIVWDVPDDRYLRASYRYGALGGRHDQGGQTTLDGAITDADTSISVANAGRLVEGETVLIYGDNVEYVDVESINHDTNTLTVSRGERSTDAVAHADGDTIHYCPLGVRKAMAGKAAEEGQLYELFTDRLVDTGDGVGGKDRIEKWADAYDRMLAKYSGVRKL